MKIVILLFILLVSTSAMAKDYKVFFKSEATDKRTNIVEPDLIFLDSGDKIIFNSVNVDLDKVVIKKINRDGVFSEVDANTYRELVDKSFFLTNEDCLYLYYSNQYMSSGAFGIAVVGNFYQKQDDALRATNYNQNFKDRLEHILNNITPVDKIVPETPPASGTPPTE